MALAGPQILDSKSEATNWKWSPLEKFDDLRLNALVDIGQYLPCMSSSELSQRAQKIHSRNDRLSPHQRDWLQDYRLSVLSLFFSAIDVAG